MTTNDIARRRFDWNVEVNVTRPNGYATFNVVLNQTVQPNGICLTKRDSDDWTVQRNGTETYVADVTVETPKQTFTGTMEVDSTWQNRTQQTYTIRFFALKNPTSTSWGWYRCLRPIRESSARARFQGSFLARSWSLRRFSGASTDVTMIDAIGSLLMLEMGYKAGE